MNHTLNFIDSSAYIPTDTNLALGNYLSQKFILLIPDNR